MHMGSVAPSVNLSADLFPELSAKIVKAIAEHDLPALSRELQSFAENETFLFDIHACGYFDQIRTTVTETGFWLNFQCVSEGDVLHPYSGFFQIVPERKIFWNSKQLF